MIYSGFTHPYSEKWSSRAIEAWLSVERHLVRYLIRLFLQVGQTESMCVHTYLSSVPLFLFPMCSKKGVCTAAFLLAWTVICLFLLSLPFYLLFIHNNSCLIEIVQFSRKLLEGRMGSHAEVQVGSTHACTYLSSQSGNEAIKFVLLYLWTHSYNYHNLKTTK